MEIKKLSERFTPTTEMAMNNKKAPAVTDLGLVLSGAAAEEELFQAQADSTMDELRKNGGYEAKTTDDKKAIGKDRDYDKEHPTKIADNEYTDPEKFAGKKMDESVKLVLDEGEELREGLQLTEDMGAAVLPSGEKVMANGWITRTRSYTTEHVEFRLGWKEAEGTYKWVNRPWQYFTYADALRDAMVKVGVSKDFAEKCIHDCRYSSLESAIDYFAEHYEEYSKTDAVDESLGTDLTKYQMWVDYDQERYGDISEKTWDKLRQAGLTVVKDRYGYWEVIAKEPIHEDTIKRNGKWMNKGKEGTHGTFRTKKAADAQRKAMFANGYKESKLTEAPMYDLDTQFDPRKSFYSKAKVDVQKDGAQVLYSYNTPVCRISADDHKVTLLPRWDESATTLRHVKEFLRQNDFKAETRAQMAKDYILPDNSLTEEKVEVKQLDNWNQGLKKDSASIDISDKLLGRMRSRLDFSTYNNKTFGPGDYGLDRIKDDLYKTAKSYVNKNWKDYLPEDLPEEELEERKEELIDNILGSLAWWFLGWAEKETEKERIAFAKENDLEYKKEVDRFGHAGDADTLYNIVYDRLFGGDVLRNTTNGIAPDSTVVVGIKKPERRGQQPQDIIRTTYMESMRVQPRFDTSFDQTGYPRYLSIRMPRNYEMEIGLDNVSDLVTADRLRNRLYNNSDSAQFSKEIPPEKYFGLMKDVADFLLLDFSLNADKTIGTIDFEGFQGDNVYKYMKENDITPPPSMRPRWDTIKQQQKDRIAKKKMEKEQEQG